MAADDAVAARFGENLIRCRRRVGLSQEELGVRASLHRTQIGLLERGLRLPRIDTLIKLAGALEVSAADLLAGISWLPGQAHEGAFSFPSPPRGRKTGEGHAVG